MNTVGEKKAGYSSYFAGGIFLLVIGLCILAISLCMLGLQIKSFSFSPVEAVVVDHHKTTVSEEGRTNTYYWNIVEYTVDGKTYKAECDYADNPDNLGEIITIYVNPANPTEVIFRHSTHTVLISFTAVIACGLFIGSAILFVKGNGLKKRS